MRKMVAGLIIENHRLLLVHNTKHNSLRIEPPGGKKEYNETWKESLKREILEELGLEVRVGRLFGVYGTQSPEGSFSVHTYFCSILKGKPQITEPDKISSFAWYKFSEIEEIASKGNLVPNMVKSLAQIGEII